MRYRYLLVIFLLAAGLVGCDSTPVKPDPTAQDYYQMGLDDQQRGDYQSAAGHFETATRMRTDFGQAYCALGAARVSLDQRSLATTAYRQCIVLMPGNVDGHAALGLLLAQGAQPVEAVVHLQRAIDLGTQNAQVYFHLAEIRSAQGECEVTVALYERALALNPGMTAAKYGLNQARKNNCKPVVKPTPPAPRPPAGGKALKPSEW